EEEAEAIEDGRQLDNQLGRRRALAVVRGSSVAVACCIARVVLCLWRRQRELLLVLLGAASC
ncbi:hypothetical protein Dimus_035560, partial [Dionaea muscipula]